MFNSDVTQSYNHQDATTEILVMLIGAFLLGCLLCWLFKKLFEANRKEVVESTNNTIGIQSNRSPSQSLTDIDRATSSVNKVRTTTSYMKPKIDDLTKISGITSGVETELKDRGIKSYIDLRDSNADTISSTLKSENGKTVSAKEARTWPHQASLAAKGDWDKLKEYQEFMSRSNETEKKVRSESKDDLKKIEGIGPKIEEILNNNEIHTFKTLNNTSRDSLKL